MKGSKYFGGEYDKLRHLTELNWDVLVIDEAHEGVDTYKTDLAFDRIRRKFTLHLSGTPFKALANDKFAGDAIFNWTTRTSRPPSGTGRAHRGSRTPTQTSPCSTSTPTRCPRSSGRNSAGRGDRRRNAGICFDLNEFFKVKPSGSFEHRPRWTAFWMP